MNKLMLIVFKVIFIIVLFFTCIIGIMFYFLGKTCYTEIHKLKETNSIDLISTIDDCGAMSSLTNANYLIKKGQSISDLDVPFLVTDTENIKYEWIKDKTLRISIPSSNIFEFKKSQFIDGKKYTFILEYGE
ncbi:MAG: hypothetical protein GY932_08950 [Arcobacter sp.]|nr:hypothetical protein [Arcobacter sp.]